MISFQVNYKVQELNVVRDRFNAEERKTMRLACLGIYFNIFYHVLKIVIPSVTLITCSS